jgi:hypothetical protein
MRRYTRAIGEIESTQEIEGETVHKGDRCVPQLTSHRSGQPKVAGAQVPVLCCRSIRR